ncbi:MAG: thermonuclease family protein [Erythrobacter sp.]
MPLGTGCENGAEMPEAEPISHCRVTDGDTLRCGDERVRLLAIDAPEKPGQCRAGRICAPGDPIASERSLRAAAKGTMLIRRVGTDRFGRTLALVEAGGKDLSCHQLETGAAIYNPKWDDGGYVFALCGETAMRRSLTQ